MQLEAGHRFEARYEIARKLGQGGFASVFLATDLASGRQVAIKILEPDRGANHYDPKTRARFEREVKIVASLRSPHSVRLFDHGKSSAGLLFAVFEYVPERDLAELLELAGGLRRHEVIHILRQLLDALREAHDQGLLHRDIKPENVRVFEYMDDPLTVKLLDFGVARATEGGHPPITATGELMGTPRYMSPEQLVDHPLSPASDIYSLGMMAFELMLGREALQGHGWGAQLERLRSGHVFSIPDMDRLGADLLAVVQRMTARDPSERYQSARDVLDALDAIQNVTTGEDAAEAPRQSHLPERTPLQPEDGKRRGSLASWLGGALFVTVAVAVVVALVAGGREPAPPSATRLPGELLKVSSPPATYAASASATADVGTTGDADAGSTDAAAVHELPPADPTGGTAGCGESPRFRGFGHVGPTLAYVPTGYRPNYKHPVVLLLHQEAETPEALVKWSRFPELSEPDDFVVLAPQGGIVGFSAWKDDHRDVEKIRAEFDRAADALCLDPERIYAVGNGQGGRAVQFLSCEPWIRAIATNSFANGNTEAPCQPAPPVPYLLLTPRHSKHAPIEGGPSCSSSILNRTSRQKLSAKEVEAMWRRRNGCRGERRSSYDSDGSECFTWTCGTPFTSCYLDGGTGWPGSEPRLAYDDGPCAGPSAPEFPASEQIWRFFEALER